MIDICTVVFESELPSLRLQARSIQRFCDKIGINAIYVMVNDSSHIDRSWWGSLSHLVEIYPRSSLGSHWHENGWVSQQALKMLGAAISDNNWCMILDAKTLFVRTVDLDEIFIGSRPATGYLPLYPVFDASRQITNDLWNIDLPEQLGPGGVPFLVEPEQVRAMMLDIYQRTGQSFADFFQAQGKLTEFVLYSGWIWFKDHGFERRYHSQHKIRACNLCHSEVKLFDSKFKSMCDSRTHTVSIHRNAWPQLSAAQQEMFLNLLSSKGLR